MAKLNKRKCAECGVEFQKQAPLQNCCSIPCAVERSHKLNKAKREKLLCEKVKEMKKGLMKKGDWLKLLQATFNTYIRMRDAKDNCISCDTPMANRKGDASHFYATTYSFLRFNEDNVHLSCVPCNQFKSGNIHEYRPRLIKKIGLEKVEWLDNNAHNKLDLPIIEIQELIKKYKNKIAELKK